MGLRRSIQEAFRAFGLKVKQKIAYVNSAGFTRRAAVLLTPAADGRPFRILSWDSGPE